MSSLFVNDAASLNEAYEILSNQPGGGTIYVEQGSEPFAMFLEGGGSGHVHVVSADPGNPTLVTQIGTNEAENITFENFKVTSVDTGRPGWQRDLTIDDSDNITVTNVDFSGAATGFYDPDDPDAVEGSRFGLISNSSDITFSDNRVAGYSQGLTVRETSDSVISGNEITEIQGDGLRFTGVQDIEISDNHLHNFYGSPNSYNHNDAIQLWSTGAETISRDIVVTGNIIDSGAGSATQGIFVNNEVFGRGDTGHVYQNITISDNIIYNGASNGIAIVGANNVTIENNTVLWNQDAIKIRDTGEVTTAPRINLDESVTNAIVTGNITAKVPDARDGLTVEDNRIVTYDSPQDENYVDNHFVNVAIGGDIGHDGWRLRLDSDWNGTHGAEGTQALTQTPDGSVHAVILSSTTGEDLETRIFDASQSVDGDGVIDEGEYTFIWSFSDGTVARGVQVEHTFPDSGSYSATLTIQTGGRVLDTAEREVLIEDTDYLVLDFENGFDDASSYDSTLDTSDAEDRIVSSADGSGYRLGEGHPLIVTRDNDQIHDLQSFSLGFDLSLEDADAEGFVVHFPRVMEGRVLEGGGFSFELTTDEGSYTVTAPPGTLEDDTAHSFLISYSDSDNALSLSIDGDTLDTVFATGITAPRDSGSLNFGDPWNNNVVDGVIDNIYLGADPTGQTNGPSSDDASGPENPVVPTGPANLPSYYGTHSSPISFSAPPLPPQEPEAPEAVPDSVEIYAQFDFEDGFRDTSGNDIAVTGAQNWRLDDGFDGQGYRIGGRGRLELDKDQASFEGTSNFSLSLDIQLLDLDDTGRFIHFPRNFEARIEDDHSITFSLQTDEGRFTLNSGDVTFEDGEPHNFAVHYSDADNTLTMEIDGQVVDQADASGELGGTVHHGLTIGSKWGDSVNAFVDNVEVSSYNPGEDAEGAAGDTDEDITDTDVDPGASDPVLNENVLAFLDFENGVSDASEYESTLRFGADENIVSSQDGSGYLIGGQDKVQLTRGNDQIHSLDKFAFEMDIQLLNNTDTGAFMHFHRVMEARIEDDRSISFKLFTDEGEVTLNSGDVTFDDGASHTFSVAYDDAVGHVALAINGNVVDSGALTGETAPQIHHGLTIGNTWNNSPLAIVDNVFLGTEASDVGIELPGSMAAHLMASAVPQSEIDDAYGTGAANGDGDEDEEQQSLLFA